MSRDGNLESQNNQAKLVGHKLKANWSVIGFGVLILITLISVTVYVWPEKSIIDSKVVANVDFPVYAPKELPAGYKLDEARTSVDDNILTYAFLTKDSHNVTVTVQPIPENFDMTQIIGGGSISTTMLNSGTLYNLSAGNGIKYLLHTGDALVFITSQDNIETSAISVLAGNIVRQK